MFTGIIRHFGTIHAIKQAGDSMRLTVTAPNLFAASKAGDSIAINGVCLTVIANDANAVSFELGAETLRKTTFSQQKTGAACNVEFPMRIGDTFDGHFVQGHVDGTAVITDMHADGETTWLSLSLPPELARLTVHKGSITVDGVSLTVAEKSGNTISIMLLPYTVEHTNFKNNRVGDPVNIETDMLARHVAELMKNLA